MRTAIVGATIVCCMTLLLALATLYPPTKPPDANEVLVTFASPISDASQASDHSDLKVSYWPDQGGLSGHPKVEKVLDVTDNDALIKTFDEARRIHRKEMLIVVNAEPCRPWMYVAPILGAAASASVRDVWAQAGDSKVSMRLPHINGMMDGPRPIYIKVHTGDQAEIFNISGVSSVTDAKGLATALAQRKQETGGDEVAIIVAPANSTSWSDVVEAVARAREAGFENVGLSASGRDDEATGPATQPRKREFGRHVELGRRWESRDRGERHTGSDDPSPPAPAPRPRTHLRSVDFHHIVFVIDRSGSMVDSFDHLRNALEDAISKLADVDDFHIVMFDETPIEFAPKQLTAATAANMAAAGKFLEGINAQGSTDPVPAIKRAFEVMNKAGETPGKLIIFLSDGGFDDNEKVLQTFKSFNTNRNVVVNTYLYADTESKAGKDIMAKIAKENGGTYKFFDTKDAQ